jgi:hypothetical protein
MLDPLKSLLELREVFSRLHSTHKRKFTSFKSGHVHLHFFAVELSGYFPKEELSILFEKVPFL